MKEETTDSPRNLATGPGARASSLVQPRLSRLQLLSLTEWQLECSSGMVDWRWSLCLSSVAVFSRLKNFGAIRSIRDIKVWRGEVRGVGDGESAGRENKATYQHTLAVLWLAWRCSHNNNHNNNNNNAVRRAHDSNGWFDGKEKRKTRGCWGTGLVGQRDQREPCDSVSSSTIDIISSYRCYRCQFQW